MTRSQIFRNNFKNDPEYVTDELQNGRRAVKVRTDNKRVGALICQDRSLTIRILLDELNINHETVRKILDKEKESVKFFRT